MAWGIDLLLMLVVQTVFLTVGGFFGELLGVPNFLLASCGLIAPIFALQWQRRGGRSPGKRILQIRVVDEHGLPPSPLNLVWKAKRPNTRR